jgi:hypothetical protein
MAPMAEYLTGRFARTRGSGAVSAAVRRPVRVRCGVPGAG